MAALACDGWWAFELRPKGERELPEVSTVLKWGRELLSCILSSRKKTKHRSRELEIARKRQREVSNLKKYIPAKTHRQMVAEWKRDPEF